MKAVKKIFIIFSILALAGCTSVNVLNADVQGAIAHPSDLHNVIIPIYHKDF